MDRYAANCRREQTTLSEAQELAVAKLTSCQLWAPRCLVVLLMLHQAVRRTLLAHPFVELLWVERAQQQRR